MIPASQLRAGMAIRHEGQLYKVISAEYHPGQGKMGGVTHAHLQNLETGAYWDHGFRSDLKLEDVPLDKVPMEFLYRDGDLCVFMNPETFEQIEIPARKLGKQAALLREQMRVAVEFTDGKPVSVQFPDVLELAVVDTAPPAHNPQDSTWKEATLENGLLVMVPQFIKTGDVIRLDTEKLQYMDRARGTAKP
jgi:elongation factor P